MQIVEINSKCVQELCFFCDSQLILFRTGFFVFIYLLVCLIFCCLFVCLFVCLVGCLFVFFCQLQTISTIDHGHGSSFVDACLTRISLVTIPDVSAPIEVQSMYGAADLTLCWDGQQYISPFKIHVTGSIGIPTPWNSTTISNMVFFFWMMISP